MTGSHLNCSVRGTPMWGMHMHALHLEQELCSKQA